MSYERCIFYTVLLAVVALDRPTLKSKASGRTGLLQVTGCQITGCCQEDHSGVRCLAHPTAQPWVCPAAKAGHPWPSIQYNRCLIMPAAPWMLQRQPALAPLRPAGHRLARGAVRDRLHPSPAPLPLLPLRLPVRRILQGEAEQAARRIFTCARPLSTGCSRRALLWHKVAALRALQHLPGLSDRFEPEQMGPPARRSHPPRSGVGTFPRFLGTDGQQPSTAKRPPTPPPPRNHPPRPAGVCGADRRHPRRHVPAPPLPVLHARGARRGVRAVPGVVQERDAGQHGRHLRRVARLPGWRAGAAAPALAGARLRSCGLAGRRHALLDSLPGTQRISGLSPAK